MLLQFGQNAANLVANQARAVCCSRLAGKNHHVQTTKIPTEVSSVFQISCTWFNLYILYILDLSEITEVDFADATKP